MCGNKFVLRTMQAKHSVTLERRKFDDRVVLDYMHGTWSSDCIYCSSVVVLVALARLPRGAGRDCAYCITHG